VLSAPSGSATKLLAWLFPDHLFAALTRGLDALPAGLAASGNAASPIKKFTFANSNTKRSK
jgi:hypothetical protein